MKSLHFKLRVPLFEVTRRHALFEILQLLDLLRDSLRVGQHATNPSLRHVRLADFLGCLTDDVFGLLLGTNKQHFLATCGYLCQLWQRLVERFDRLRQVDDMRLLSLAMNIWRHLWVPTAGFVSKVNTGFQQSLDVYIYRHVTPLSSLAALESRSSCVIKNCYSFSIPHLYPFDNTVRLLYNCPSYEKQYSPTELPPCRI